MTPKVVAIVQARMSSTRLPGKVLADVGGRPLLDLLIRRLSRASLLQEVVVATSTDSSDDPISDWSRRSGVLCVRGPLFDVLERYRITAEARSADVVVRITADCPLVDPQIVDDLVRTFLTERLVYCGISGGFPHGLDCEVFSREALETAAAEAILPADREHVTLYMKRNRVRYPTGVFAPIAGHEEERWTVDHPEDLELVRALAAVAPHLVEASAADILALLHSHPEIRTINQMRCIDR